MSFPDLIPVPTGVMHAAIAGVPSNGVNEFDSGIDLERFDKSINVDDWLVVRVWSLGASVTGATFVARVGNKLRINFQQSGMGQALVEASFTHSVVR
jgi:hypothetical protein